LQLTPQSRVFVALAPVDFRNGIDGLAAVCRRAFGQNPLDGAIYVFRNRTGTALKVLSYDGQGYWLTGRLHNASLCNCSGRGQIVMTALRFSGK
jgi:transposase